MCETKPSRQELKHQKSIIPPPFVRTFKINRQERTVVEIGYGTVLKIRREQRRRTGRHKTAALIHQQQHHTKYGARSIQAFSLVSGAPFLFSRLRLGKCSSPAANEFFGKRSSSYYLLSVFLCVCGKHVGLLCLGSWEGFFSSSPFCFCLFCTKH